MSRRVQLRCWRRASGGHTEVLSSMGKRMMHGFAQAIREGRDLQPTLSDGLRVQAVIDAALRSNVSRRWERVAPT